MLSGQAEAESQQHGIVIIFKYSGVSEGGERRRLLLPGLTPDIRQFHGDTRSL